MLRTDLVNRLGFGIDEEVFPPSVYYPGHSRRPANREELAMWRLLRDESIRENVRPEEGN